MPALNQIMVSPGQVGLRHSLQTKDGTAVFECLQQLTPEEARIYGRELIGAADTAESKATQKAARDGGEKKAAKKKATKRKADKKARRH